VLKALFDVMSKYEWVAVWLEAVALIAIFFLDFSEYKKQGKDREEQHKETLEQMRIMEQQANSASDSLRLLRTQWLEERRRELLRAVSILDEIRFQSTHWKEISDNKWGSVNEASSIMPPDSNLVLIQAVRHSNELRSEVRETFRLLANADYQIARFYSVDRPSYRIDQLMKDAHLNLVNAEPKLAKIVDAFEQMESTAQSERALA
jgi:hypothetical protein